MPGSAPAFDPAALRRLAVIGFMGHAPGLKLLGQCRFSPALTRRNLWALGATLAAMAIAYASAPQGGGWLWLAVAWLVGHFAWSAALARAILSGEGVVPRATAALPRSN